MSELNTIKQAMADGEHTDGDLQWCVERIEELQAQLDEVRDEAERLWVLLDDISTAGDMFKPEITNYFKYVNRKCDERDGMVTSDGHKLIWKQALQEGE